MASVFPLGFPFNQPPNGPSNEPPTGRNLEAKFGPPPCVVAKAGPMLKRSGRALSGTWASFGVRWGVFVGLLGFSWMFIEILLGPFWSSIAANGLFHVDFRVLLGRVDEDIKQICLEGLGRLDFHQNRKIVFKSKQ